MKVDRLEELKEEMKTLIDLEVLRMKIRHTELMWWAVPRIILAIAMGALLIWADWRFSK